MSNLLAPPDADPALACFVGVQKTYDGETLVIKDLNLSVRRGEFLTLLGPSGSGKTTTLLMLAGFEHPTSGHIELEGRRLERVPAYRRNLGMVFQDYALFPHMTVAENVGFPLSVRGRSKETVARLVKSALAMVKLAGYEDRRPNQVSGGQQQRVALARALVFEPRLVLMDEPLGALDKQLREQMQLEIKRIQQQLGITVVYVTHDQSEALVMSDRIAVFSEGRIRQIDTPAELYERPTDAFVAQFIGENNQFPGRIVSLDGGTVKVELAGGTQVRAVRVDSAGVGTATLLSLRPERVILDPADGECDNRFTGRVEELIYFGDHARVRLVLDATPELVAKVPLGRRARPVEPGDRLAIGWHAEDCRALTPP